MPLEGADDPRPEILASLTRLNDARAWREAMLFSRLQVSEEAVAVVVTGGLDFVLAPQRWAVSAPEAVEVLVTLGMLPARWTDPHRAPGWWCVYCGGAGRIAGGRRELPNGQVIDWTQACTCADQTSPRAGCWDVFTVASLGVEAVARIESVVTEAWPGRRLVFRPLFDWTPAEQFNVRRQAGALRSLARLHALESIVTGRQRWPEAFPWGEEGGDGWREAWSAVRALALTGAHLLVADAERIVVGVVREGAL